MDFMDFPPLGLFVMPERVRGAHFRSVRSREPGGDDGNREDEDEVLHRSREVQLEVQVIVHQQDRERAVGDELDERQEPRAGDSQ
jgi:hypothetical protein